MNIILLSGGSGKRLWPLSNEIRSKQFIKLFRTSDGAYESMVQRVYRQIRSIDANADITIATAKSQVSAIHSQLGLDADISLEPCRRDTFPAIALATAYLHDIKGVPEYETVVVCPVDPYVDDDYFLMLKKLNEQAKISRDKLILMGVEPTYPSEKYGYIIPENSASISSVRTFREKPDRETAGRYIEQGALWNGGVFAYRLSYVLAKAHELLGSSEYEALFSAYDTLPKISFDYAVVEKEPDIQVMRFSGMWKDIGTWNTLAEEMSEQTQGNTILDEACENVTVINELSLPVLCMGLRDTIVAVSGDGVLVSDRGRSSFIKPYADKIAGQIMYADKSWGTFTVLDVQDESMTICIRMQKNHRLTYHSHEHRDEVWTIVSGEGRTVVDGMEQKVSTGDVITMQAGCRHTVIADSDLKIIEVQLGREIDAHDKQVFPFE